MSAPADIPPGDVTAVHLDAVGGAAGDMFAASLLDAMPSLWPFCERAIAAMSPPSDVTAAITAYSDGVLTGSKFNVAVAGTSDGHHDHGQAHSHTYSAAHEHDHHRWRDIRSRIEAADLLPAERAAALGIFTRLAIAEAAVHGIAVDEVSFHEVGAWDSIIDIVVAAALIAQLPGCSWSIGALPRGRGLVKSAHGMLPIPAPATVELLKDFDLYDDGEDGERITPTGAAILAYLTPSQSADFTPRRLLTTGTGFGTRSFKRRSNILRTALYGGSLAKSATETIEVLRCEIDDQTPEDLSIALERLRQCDGVLDVCQWPVFGKKGRMATAVQVLVGQRAGTDVVRAILDETTTLGVRRSIAGRETIERTMTTSGEVRVKVATRPSAMTAKAEAADLESIATHDARQRTRLAAEQGAVAPKGHNEEGGSNA